DGFTITGGNANGPQSSGSQSGGGLNNEGGSPILSNLSFTGNAAQNRGGGIWDFKGNSTASPTILNVTFSENSAAGGGAIFISASSTFVMGINRNKESPACQRQSRASRL